MLRASDPKSAGQPEYRTMRIGSNEPLRASLYGTSDRIRHDEVTCV